MEGVLPELREMLFGKRAEPIKPALPDDLTLHDEEKKEAP